MTIVKKVMKTAKQRLHPLQNPDVFKKMMNIYSPYLGAGIKVDQVDFKAGLIRATMPLTPLNKNFVGTQFGGSLYSMTDPFVMLLLMQKLGDDYVVWDKSASIDFIKAGSGTVSAEFHISDEEVATIKSLAQDGSAVFRDYTINICNKQGDVIAKVQKKLYIRLRAYSKSKTQSARV